MDTRNEYRTYERALELGDAAVCDYWADWMDRVRPQAQQVEVACANCNHWMSAHEAGVYAAMKGQCGWCSCRQPEAKIEGTR